MNFRQITQFLAVVETQSFRKAAERLHIAQPPLSTGIRRLEADLGAPLFERSKRGVRLTDAGRVILVDAQQIAFHAEQLRSAVVALRNGVGGRLRIGFVGSATYAMLPRVLPLFRERYPNVVLDLREGTTTQILRDLEAGALDLGLVRYPVAEATRFKGDVRLPSNNHAEKALLIPWAQTRSRVCRHRGLRRVVDLLGTTQFA